MKKLRNGSVFALVLVLALVLSLLAGCGGTEAAPDTQEPTPETQAPAAAPEAPEAPEEKVPEAPEEEVAAEPEFVDTTSQFFPLATSDSLSIWVPFAPILTTWITGIEENAVIVEVQERLGIDLEITNAPVSTAAQNMNIMLASGEYTDIISMFGQYYTTGSMDSAVSDGIVVDLAPYVSYDSYMPNYAKVLAENPAFDRNAKTDTGKMAQAMRFTLPNEPVPMGLVIRTDLLEKVGMDIPVTYDDYYNVLTAFKTELGVESPLWLGYLGGVQSQTTSAGYGVTSFEIAASSFYIQKDGVAYYSPAEEGYREYLTTMNKWYTEGLVYQDFMNMDSGGYSFPNMGEAAGGKYGIFNTSADNLPSYVKSSEIEGYALAGLSSPVVNEGDTLHIRMNTDPSDGAGFALTTCCENIELGCRYLDYWFTDEGGLLANYGVEGQSMEFVDGKPVMTDLIMNNPEGMPVSLAKGRYVLKSTCQVIDWNAVASQYDEVQSAATEAWGRDDADWLYPVTAVTLTDEENSEYATIYGDIQTYVTEMTLKFITGEEVLNDETWNDYLSILEERGLSTCLAIRQAALDRYNAR